MPTWLLAPLSGRDLVTTLITGRKTVPLSAILYLLYLFLNHISIFFWYRKVEEDGCEHAGADAPGPGQRERARLGGGQEPQGCCGRRLTNLTGYTLQRQNTEISKQIFSKKEYRGLSPNFYVQASVSDLYIPTVGLPILLEEICRPMVGLYKWLTDT
jgi:hypothetical protein